MYRATREFIKARQPFCSMPLLLVKPMRVGGGTPNRCYENAYNAKMIRPNTFMVPGWLVSPLDPVKGISSIIAHWWNITDGDHWDTSPRISSDNEYLLDGDIYRFAYENDSLLKSHIPSSLLFDGKAFQLVWENENLELITEPISTLRSDILFKPCIVKASAHPGNQSTVAT
jgi:hypothetical protein